MDRDGRSEMGMYEFRAQDAYDFANFVHAKVAERHGELFFQLCPYCHPKPTRDNLRSFSINLTTGQFKCLRASCGVSGNMLTLSKDFDFSLGSEVDEYYRPKRQFRRMKTPKNPIQPKPEAIAYLVGRGISEPVIQHYQITVQTKHPNILVFPFFDERGILQFVKYRKTDFDKTRDSNKEWCETNTKPILFGMMQCVNFDRLILTEGQIDSLSVATAGFHNAVSVPTGAKGFTWIPYCWNWMNQFTEIVVFGDYEKGKISLLGELSKRMPTKIRHVREEDYRDCKDANEILQKYGVGQIQKCIEHSAAIPVKQVIELADVEEVDLFQLEKLKTPLSKLNRLLYGGLPFGGLTILSGKPGEGKLLADETSVFTKNGWKTHGDLVVGDEVIGRNGSFVKVTHVFPKGYANMKLTFNNNEVLYCHENHEWVTNLHFGSGYKEKIMTTKELFDKKERGFTHPLRLIQRQPLMGMKVDLAVKPYTLGVWLGDGRNGNPDVCSSKKDICVIESIIRDDGYEIAWQTEHKLTGVMYFGLKRLREQLQKYDMCHSRKKKEKYIPQDYLIAELPQRLELLAGLLDTDGYYDKEKHGYTYSTCSERLRDTFMDLIHTFGWTCNYTIQKAKLSTSGIQGRKDCYLIQFIPIGLSIPCRVERKRQDMIKEYSKRMVSIRNIEYCSPKQGNCIEVEGGIYCVGKTMIPTHNSTLASQILVSAIAQGYSCFAYSGELPNYLFRTWIDFQIAGPQHVYEYQNRYGDKNYSVSKTNRTLIGEWYRGKFYLYDNASLDGEEKESLCHIVELVIQQYGVRVILLDNLMTALDLEAIPGSDKYERQSLFVKKLSRIALKYNVLILLVAHKRKNNYSTNENDEVSGSGDITNLALLTLSYERGKDLLDSQRICKVSKNRLFGKVHLDGWVLNFQEKSKRIYGDGDDVNYEYGWNQQTDGFGFLGEEEVSPFT